MLKEHGIMRLANSSVCGIRLAISEMTGQDVPIEWKKFFDKAYKRAEAQITTCKGHFKPGDISPCKRDSREPARKHPVSCNSEEDEEANQTDQIQLAAGRSANFPPRRARAALEGLVGIAACRDSLRGDMSAMLTVSARHSASGKGTTSCLCGHTVNREKPESVVWLSRPATYVAIKNVVGLCRTELNLVGCVNPLDARYASP